MAKIIGLTGGIGSGKTTIANYFAEMGVPLYIADDEAKKVMQSEKIVKQIKLAFGDSLFENDVLNRAKLAEIVFNDADKLATLNAIVHPAVKEDFELWLLKNKKYHYVIYEAAKFFIKNRAANIIIFRCKRIRINYCFVCFCVSLNVKNLK
jgi:dephospho-CoA kinase